MSIPYKWLGSDGGWKIGTVEGVDGHDGFDDSLMRHSHTGELEWVATNKLSPYIVPPEWQRTKNAQGVLE